MNLTFLAHSGFVIETQKAILVFDYYQDPAHILDRQLEGEKPCLFLVSHNHEDHWNQAILDYGKQNSGHCRYVLERAVAKTEAVQIGLAPDNYLTVEAGDRITADQLKIPGLLTLNCYRSNDEGVAFLLETDEGFIYHAGDLNDWNWGDQDAPYYERTYREELAKLQADLSGRRLAMAMVPVDHRLGDKALSGAIIFAAMIQTDLLVPMHLNGDPDLPRKLAENMDTSCYFVREGVDKEGRPVVVTDVLYEGDLSRNRPGKPGAIMSLTQPGDRTSWPF